MISFEQSYLELGEAFYKRSLPTRFEQSSMLLWNQELASELGLKALNSKEQLALACGSDCSPEGLASLAYAGHQFGHFVPQLGDGRAHLIGEHIDPNGVRWDLQLKGSGPSAFSRGGDGFCALGPALREYIMSEAMHALGVPTCRTFSVAATGEQVQRDSMQPGAIVGRAAKSHIRIGTFQYLSARQDIENLKKLANYTIARHYPSLNDAYDTNDSERYIALLRAFLQKQIHLVCEWMRVGFIHGVMNTDNVTLSGDTIDYGPCAMMGNYNPDAVFSSIDRQGRYAFSSQPDITLWNCTRFAECLIPLIDDDSEKAVARLMPALESFHDTFSEHYFKMLHHKFGFQQHTDNSLSLIKKCLATMAHLKLDHTNTFFNLSYKHIEQTTKTRKNEDIHTQPIPPDIHAILDSYQETTENESNPVFSSACIETTINANPVVVPRNHNVEAALSAAINANDLGPTQALIKVLSSPYKWHADKIPYMAPAEDYDQNYKTFCGT